MKDSDSFRLIDEATAGKWVGIGLAALLLAYALTSTWDYADKLEAEALEKAERAVMIQMHIEALNKLSHPCMASIAQGGTSVTMEPERCVRVSEWKR